MFDPEKFGEAMAALVRDAVAPLKKEIEDLTAKLSALPAPAAGPMGPAGPAGERGQDGAKGADGIGVAGAMIDRDGALQLTLANGEVKNLGRVVGKDGETPTAPKDGVDGVGFESFELEYIPESHEVQVKASAAGRVKEIRFPAGGIRPAGYWRDKSKAKANEAWVHDGSTWYAVRDTAEQPSSKSADWIIGARRGRDGDNVVRTIKPAGPIPLSK